MRRAKNSKSAHAFQGGAGIKTYKAEEKLDFVEFHTIIHSEFKKKMLFRGLLIALPGLGLLIGYGAFAPLSILESQGWLVFIIGIGLIAMGLIPYRRLSRYEYAPKRLILTETALVYQNRSFPYETISECSYIERSAKYGVVITYEEGSAFLPYFSRRQSEQCRAYVQDRRAALLREREGL